MEATILVEIEELLKSQSKLNNFSSFIIGYLFARHHQNSILEFKNIMKSIQNLLN